MRILRACLLIIAIACTAQAGDMQCGFTSQAPDTGADLLLLLESLLYLI
jgi:hypothetical protein